MSRKFQHIDITDKVFGRLRVIRRLGCDKHGNAFWLCKCECGNEKRISSASLRRGMTLSCGCLGRERRKEATCLPNGVSASHRLFRMYIKGARERKLEFSIVRETFLELTKKPCYYCGIQPSQSVQGRGQNGAYIYNGIDRIDSGLGYTSDNVVPCCGNCNEMKMERSVVDFLEHISRIYKHVNGGIDARP